MRLWLLLRALKSVRRWGSAVQVMFDLLREYADRSPLPDRSREGLHASRHHRWLVSCRTLWRPSTSYEIVFAPAVTTQPI